MYLEEANYEETMTSTVGNKRYAMDDKLIVKFYSRPRRDKEASKAEGRPIHRDVTYVNIRIPGNRDHVIDSPASDVHKRRFSTLYKAFLAKEDADKVVGTRLEEWPGISRSECEDLRHFNVRTVEQLAGMSDGASSQIPGILRIEELKHKAARYLEASVTNAAAEALASAQEQIAALKSRLDAIESEEVDEG